MKIIDSIILIVIAGYVLYNSIIHHPYMKLIVKYKDVPAVNTNLWLYRINTHYRGFDVGKVTKIKLSEDQNYVEFHINIYYKDLKLPKNTLFVFKTENLYGKRYVDIEPADSPSKDLLSDGDTVMGVTAYERFDEFLLKELKTGQGKKLIGNLNDITDVIKKSLEDLENEKLLIQSAGDLAVILENLKEIAGDKSVKTDFKSTIKLSKDSFKNINEILSSQEVKDVISNAPESIDVTISNVKSINQNLDKVSQNIPEVTKSLTTTNSLLTNTNSNLSTINNKVPPVPPSLIENTEKLILKTDCFESEVSKMLTKKFLILKLIFGNPGKSFRNCVKKKCGCPNEITED